MGLKAKGFGTACYVALCATLAEQSAAAVLMSKLLDTSALDYLRRRTQCVLRCKFRKSFLLRLKKKNTEHQKRYSVFLAEFYFCIASLCFLNLTPCELQSQRLWHYVLCCAMRNARGAIGGSRPDEQAPRYVCS